VSNNKKKEKDIIETIFLKKNSLSKNKEITCLKKNKKYNKFVLKKKKL
jgi:hypothetical protein